MSSSIPPAELTRREDLVAFVSGEYPKVVASVALITGDHDGAEDSVQEALASLWQRDDGFKPENIAAWVTVVAANGSRSKLRRHGIEARAVDRMRTDPVVTSDPTSSIGDAQLVANALDGLPDRQRQIAVLFYLGDHSVRDIAEVLEVSEGTVKTQLSRARTTLRTSLERGDDQ